MRKQPQQSGQDDKRAATRHLPDNEVRIWEKKARANAASKYYGRAIAGYVKRWSLRAFIGAVIVIILMGIGETALNAIGVQVTDLYKETFEVCKTIALTLLGFTFASKLDELLTK